MLEIAEVGEIIAGGEIGATPAITTARKPSSFSASSSATISAPYISRSRAFFFSGRLKRRRRTPPSRDASVWRVPYFTLGSSLLVLSLYLLMSSYTYLRVVTARVHRLSYGGMGATEFRLLVASWALFAALLGSSATTAQAYGFVVLDLVIGGLSGLTFLGFVVVIQKDLARMQREEREIMELLPPALAAHEPSMIGSR